jgi:hypothetical protein
VKYFTNFLAHPRKRHLTSTAGGKSGLSGKLISCGGSDVILKKKSKITIDA